MPQQVNIHLGGEPGNLTQADFNYLHSGTLELSYLADATDAGRSAVLLAGRMPDGKLVGFQITGRILMSIAGVVRGKMIETGEIPVKLNPGIAMQAGAGVVHFAAEAPLQSWDFTADEAKRWWRVLREIAEIAAAQKR